MNYAGAVKAPTQSTSISPQTDVSKVGLEHDTWKQRPAVSITNRSVTSVSRSVGTTTRVAVVNKTAAPSRSSPLKKGEKSFNPCLSKQQGVFVPEFDVYFIIKTNKQKVMENSPSANVKVYLIKNVRISPI